MRASLATCGKDHARSAVAFGMIPVQRLNHAVLYVRDADRVAAFYEEAFGFEVVERIPGVAVFLRAAGTDNHHDLGLFSVGANAPGPEQGRVGLYHLAWQVSSIHDLAAGRQTLSRLGALVGASDHGATKSLYGKDPDGNEFEIMWMVPREQWGEHEHQATTEPLDLDAELARWG
jgi:catechol-2,3-dioxygenase